MVRKKTAKLRAPRWGNVVLGTILFVGLGIGLLAAYKAGANQQSSYMPAIATGSELELAHKTIADQYLYSSIHCAGSSDSLSLASQAEVFYKYLRVNVHDDRAVIRGCDDHDTLLAKINGTWQATNVNMSLDAAANPVWQKACDITDITRADTRVRPENRSIDASNLKMCQALQDNKILGVQDL